MTRLSCWKAADAIERRDHLADAERLELETHLEGCARCAEYATLVASVRAAAAAEPPRQLTPPRRERLIDRALSGAADAPREARPRGRSLGWIAAGVAATAVVATVLLWAPRPTAPSPPRPARVASSDPAPPAQTEPAPPAAPSQLAAGVGARFGRATVRAIEPATVRWDDRAETLYLTAGVIDVDVEPGDRRFAVATERFTVEVLGTRFVVSATEVRVERGAVRVLGPDGTPRVDRLAAGHAWSESRPRAEAPAAPPRVEPPAPSVRRRLARARRLLAASRLDDARAQIDAALRAGPSRRERAEAETLLGDHARVAGRPAEAIERYLRVGRAYDDLAEGDNASFSAARLRMRHGPPAAGRALLEEYLARYPEGRFRDEAARRLRSAGDPR